MDRLQAPFTLLLALAAAVSTVLAAHAWRRRSAPGARAFAALMAAVAHWSLWNAIQLGSSTLEAKVLCTRVQYLGIVAVPGAWLAFALGYTGRGALLRASGTRAALLLPALATFLLMCSNSHHGLVWSAVELDLTGGLPALLVRHGPWFWIHVAYSYLLLLAGTLLLLPRASQGSPLSRAQAGALLAGVAAPWAANVAFVLGLVPRLDPTPFALTLSGLAFSWALFRFRLLDVGAFAREFVLEKMSDGLLVVDAEERVVDMNPAAARLLGLGREEALGRGAAAVLPAWPRLPGQDAEGAAEPYDLTVSPLLSDDGTLAGRAFVWRDISRRRVVEAEVRGQKQLFESLVAVARATSERPTLEATLQNALDVVAERTGAQGGSLCLLDGSGSITKGLFVAGGVSLVPERELLDIMERGLAGSVARSRQPALVEDILEDERWLKVPGQELAIRSALAVPIVSGSSLLGIVGLDHAQPGYFTAEHLAFLTAAAEQIGLALRNAQMYEERARLAERQTMLYELLHAVGEQLDAQAVATAAVQTIARLTGWPNVVLAVPGETREQWSIAAASRTYARGERGGGAGGVIGRAFASGALQVVGDVSADPDYLADHPHIRSELALPLRRGERVLGVLNLESDRAQAFGPEEVRTLESLADAVALGLDNARLHEEAAAEQTRQAAVIQTSRDGLLLVGRDRRVLVLNEPALALLGLPGVSADWLGNPIDDVLQALVEQAPDVVQATLAELRRIRTGEEPAAEGEYEAPPLVIRWQSLPVRSGSAALGRLMVLRDVTEERMLRQAQQAVAEQKARLEALIDSSRDGIVLFGLDGRFLVVNEAAVRILRLPGAAGDWVGRPLARGFRVLLSYAPELKEMVRGEATRIRSGREAPGEGEYEAQGVVVRWLTLPVMSDADSLGRLLVLRDVSEERALERLRDDLTNTMVHDLRNPLTTITAVLEQFEGLGDSLPAPRREMLRIALGGSQRLAALVSAILDVSRLESGRMPLERERLALFPLVAEAVRLQQPVAADTGRGIDNGVGAELPAVFADPTLVSRVLLNLLSNAMKFTPAGGRVRVGAQLEGVGTLALSVSDEGPGIGPELQGRLFQKFVTGRHKGRGSGLGLAFCRLAVEAHGGRIWADSLPGQGATFTFTLPLAP